MQCLEVDPVPLLRTESHLAGLAREAGLGDAAVIVERLTAEAWTARWLLGAKLSPASMIKTPLAAAVLMMCGSGLLERDASAEVHERNMTANDASSPLVPGYRASIDELLGLMIERSDNVATNELIDRAGRSRANVLLAGLGLAGTFVRGKLSGAEPQVADPQRMGRNAHPAEDAARLFERIAARGFPGAEALEGMLERQVWNSKLSLGWREGDRFAHKTGDTSEVSHDGGILTTAEGARYVIVVYTPLESGPNADERIGAFAAALRPLL